MNKNYNGWHAYASRTRTSTYVLNSECMNEKVASNNNRTAGPTESSLMIYYPMALFKLTFQGQVKVRPRNVKF